MSKISGPENDHIYQKNAVVGKWNNQNNPMKNIKKEIELIKKKKSHIPKLCGRQILV